VGESRLNVLLVERDGDRRLLMGEWLAAEQMDVLWCPGPSAPDYSCVGVRSGACPLASEADAVVLDIRVDSDLVAEGASGFDLVSYYRSEEKPLVVLVGGDRLGLLAEPGVEVLSGSVRADDLVRSIRRVARRSADGGLQKEGGISRPAG
jgi:CheY-like chemotaxis protein